MPFARVGAMPPPAHNDEHQGSQESASARPNRQKGITMEDLKKQTALRLAQEQQQGQSLSTDSSNSEMGGSPALAVDSKGRPVLTSEILAARSHSASSISSREPTGAGSHPPHSYQRLHHQNPMVHPTPDINVAQSYGSGRYYDQSLGTKNPRKKGGRPPPSVNVPTAAHSTAFSMPAGSTYHSDQRSQYARSSPVPTIPTSTLTSATAYDNASSNQGMQSGGSASKLPHGLTVHELKEMTKARLQAEAAEKLSGGHSDRSSMTERGSLDFRGTPTSNYVQQVNSQDFRNQIDARSNSGKPARLSPSPSTFAPYHPVLSSFYDAPEQDIMVGNRGRVHSCPDTSWDNRLQANRNRVDSYPEIAGNRNRFDSLPEMHEIRNRNDLFPGMVGNRNRMDSFPDSNWESASVTSHNSTVASDYLGSESAFSSGPVGFVQGDDASFLPLDRTHSFPTGNARVAYSLDTSRENTPTSAPSPQGNYLDSTTSTAQNRGRSLTLSPRAGLSLLHEDRPGFIDEGLSIPSFSSHYGHQQIAAHSHGQTASINGYRRFGSDSNRFGVVPSDNRPRTSSTTSLPAISHTDEEFSFDSNIPVSSQRSPENDRFGIQTGSDEYYGSANFYGNKSSKASGVFRDRFEGLVAPPGLGPRNGLDLHASANTNPSTSQVGVLDNFGSNRARAATWNPGCSGFGVGTELYQYAGEDILAGDLASILKLSGAEEKPDNGQTAFNDMSASFVGVPNYELKENESRSRTY